MKLCSMMFWINVVVCIWDIYSWRLTHQSHHLWFAILSWSGAYLMYRIEYPQCYSSTEKVD